MAYNDCFQILPQLETERLILRQIQNLESDGTDTLEFINDIDVYRYWGAYDTYNDTNGKHRPKVIKDTSYLYNSTMRNFKAKHELSWVLELKSEHKVIGEIMLYNFAMKKQAELGYRINANYWGKGFAVESGKAIVKLAFEEMDIFRLNLRCFKDNEGSKRVAEKIGFIQEGFIRKGLINKVFTDNYIFGYLQEDYLNENKV